VSTRVVERERERSPSPPGQLRARVIETRERIPVRERSPSPVRYRERIIERERERSPSPARSEHVRITETREEVRQAPSLSSSPSPPPFIRAPPIHQEIITHHRHIDHGSSLYQHLRLLLTSVRLRSTGSSSIPTSTASSRFPACKGNRHRHTYLTK